MSLFNKHGNCINLMFADVPGLVSSHVLAPISTFDHYKLAGKRQ